MRYAQNAPHLAICAQTLEQWEHRNIVYKLLSEPYTSPIGH